MSSWRSRFRRAFSTGSELADETEAYLAGRYLEQTRAGGGECRIQPWMWLNALAHGSYQRVQELSVGVRDVGPTGDWRDMRIRVAQELEQCCRGDRRELDHLQQAVLVPLELRLLANGDLTPAQVTDIVLLELKAADS
jgi:hypothetical protein